MSLNSFGDALRDPDAERALVRRAITISADAVAHGNHPFGALLAGPDGEVLLEAENTVVTTRDVTGHAETNLVRLASAAYDEDVLRRCTLVTSCEPCAMCSGAIYWAGIGRVVYAMGEDTLRAITGADPANPTLDLPCRTVFAGGARPTEVAGPFVEDEAAAHHRGFWV